LFQTFTLAYYYYYIKEDQIQYFLGKLKEKYKTRGESIVHKAWFTVNWNNKIMILPLEENPMALHWGLLLSLHKVN